MTANRVLDLGGAASSRICRFQMKMESPDSTGNGDMGVEDTGKLDLRDRKKQDIRMGKGSGDVERVERRRSGELS